MTTYLLIGSNMGRKETYLMAARQAIGVHIGFIKAVSALYRTAAWGNEQQDDFVNQALAVETRLSPPALLTVIHSIEQQIGRRRKEKWEPRMIDIDILLYEDICMQTPDLTIPHPHLPYRRFALTPLCDIAPQQQHPQLQQTIADLLRHCPDTLPVQKIY